jgi:hypothetical protein
MKSCDAPESNRIIIGHSLRKNVPATTSWCCSWHSQSVVQDPSDDPSVGSPRVRELAVSCFALAGSILEQSGPFSHS